jgi:hypothetical protein
LVELGVSSFITQSLTHQTCQEIPQYVEAKDSYNNIV